MRIALLGCGAIGALVARDVYARVDGAGGLRDLEVVLAARRSLAEGGRVAAVSPANSQGVHGRR